MKEDDRVWNDTGVAGFLFWWGVCVVVFSAVLIGLLGLAIMNTST